MTINPLKLIGGDGSDRLFAPHELYFQEYYKFIDGGDSSDLLYGGYGTVQLIGGLGADVFILGATPGGTGTIEYTYIFDYSAADGDKLSLSGGLTSVDVTVRSIDSADLVKLTYNGPERPAATQNDTAIVDNATGQYLAILKDTQPEAVSFVDLASLNLTPAETAALAPPTGGRIPVVNFNPFVPGFGPRIVEYADYSQRPGYYLSSALYTTLAGSADTFNKFVSFDFSDPSAPYGTYLNGRVGPLQHTHSNELELFFVVSGNYIFTEGPQVAVDKAELMDVKVPAGTLCYGPLGRVHGFRGEPDDGPSRIFSLAIPAGLDKFFENAGTAVSNRFDQIKPNSQTEAVNTAFWAAQRNDQLFLTPWDLGNMMAPAQPGAPLPWSQLRPPYDGRSIAGQKIPTFSPTWPGMVTTSVEDEMRPVQASQFGEKRIALVSPDEAAAITGRVAWKGPFSLPFQAGASFQYDYLSFDPLTNTDFAATQTIAPSFPDPLDPTPSSFVVLYSLSGDLSLQLFDQIDPGNPSQRINPVFQLDPLTFVQLPTGTRYSLANSGSSQAEALSILIFNQTNPPQTSTSTGSQNSLPAPEVLLLSGDPSFAALDFKLTAAPASAFLSGRNIQIAVFSVDEQNRIICDCEEGGMGMHTISPEDPDYLIEALASAKVIMSVINRRAGQPLGSTSSLTNFASNRQVFLVVEGTTVADALAALEAGTAINGSIRMGEAAATMQQNGANIDIAFGFGNAKDIRIQATARPTSDLANPLKLGPFNWNYTQQNLGLLDLTYDLDSRSLANTNIDVVINSFSRNLGAGRQRIGFYQVLDELGTVLDPITRTPITASKENAAAYLAAVQATASSSARGFVVDSTRALNHSSRLEGGYLYAPFFTASSGSTTQTFVPFAAVNPDGLQHNVSTATNAWSWEDGFAGSGSRRFDDLSFGLAVISPFAARNQALAG